MGRGGARRRLPARTAGSAVRCDDGPVCAALGCVRAELVQQAAALGVSSERAPRAVFESLLAAYDDPSSLPDHVSSYVRRNAVTLEHLYRSYRADPRDHAYLFTPEGLAILERLSTAAGALEDAWPPELRSELQRMAEIAGVRLDGDRH